MFNKRVALIYEGYRYLKHKSTKYKTWWRCDSFKNGCKGWIVEESGKFIMTRKHNHQKKFSYKDNYFEEILPVRF